MPQSLVKNLIHLIYSTKHREPWILKAYKDMLYAYQAGIFKQWDSPAIIIGGIGDYVHALFSQSEKHALIKIVEEVKKGSSKWIKTGDPSNEDFYWRSGYAAFSVSESSVPAVKEYIRKQEEHHRKMSFQDKLLRYPAFGVSRRTQEGHFRISTKVATSWVVTTTESNCIMRVTH